MFENPSGGSVPQTYKNRLGQKMNFCTCLQKMRRNAIQLVDHLGSPAIKMAVMPIVWVMHHAHNLR